jgi:hypothetical protein
MLRSMKRIEELIQSIAAMQLMIDCHDPASGIKISVQHVGRSTELVVCSEMLPLLEMLRKASEADLKFCTYLLRSETAKAAELLSSEKLESYLKDAK